jgi:hypothetical protein
MTASLQALGLAAAGLLTLSVEANGQGWVRLPNGEVGYMTDYLTSGLFKCSQFIYGGTCVANGNSVTITNGGAALTLTFEGAGSLITATNQSIRIPIGTITSVVSGNVPFVFPPIRSRHAHYLTLSVPVSTLSPLRSRRIWTSAYLLRGNGLRSIMGAPISFPVAGGQPGTTYRMLALEKFTNPNIPGGNGSWSISASASIAPEPATIILLGSGLFASGAVARHRRRRRT